MKKRTVYIYGLYDPRDNQLKYIGKSKDPEARLRTHISMAKTRNFSYPKCCWIRELLAKELRPYFEILEEVPTSEWKKTEKKWIAKFRLEGCNLTNVSRGGSGGVGSKKGRKLSRKTRQKMSVARQGSKNPNYGKTTSNEIKQKISKSLKSNKERWTLEMRRKISKANTGSGNGMYGKVSAMKGKTHTPEARKKISDARKKYWENWRKEHGKS